MKLPLPTQAGIMWDSRCAVCSAPGKGGHEARRIGPEGITLTERGKGSNTRYINSIAMENEDFCDSLPVTEVFTPAGNWSSYPSHRHDEDDFPRITCLEETYYHRLNPAAGFGIQRVYTDDGSLNETMAIADGDVVLVPRGHHSCTAPHGFDMYYLNVMAGPLRKWRFVPAPEVEWILERDACPDEDHARSNFNLRINQVMTTTLELANCAEMPKTTSGIAGNACIQTRG